MCSLACHFQMLRFFFHCFDLQSEKNSHLRRLSETFCVKLQTGSKVFLQLIFYLIISKKCLSCRLTLHFSLSAESRHHLARLTKDRYAHPTLFLSNDSQLTFFLHSDSLRCVNKRLNKLKRAQYRITLTAGIKIPSDSIDNSAIKATRHHCCTTSSDPGRLGDMDG